MNIVQPISNSVWIAVSNPPTPRCGVPLTFELWPLTLQVSFPLPDQGLEHCHILQQFLPEDGTRRQNTDIDSHVSGFPRR